MNLDVLNQVSDLEIFSLQISFLKHKLNRLQDFMILNIVTS